MTTNFFSPLSFVAVFGSGIRDPGSGKNLFRIPDPGVKKHPIPDPGSGSETLQYGDHVLKSWMLFQKLKKY